MRICLICEGCYPYVVGGVSSWVAQLIENFPQYEFTVYAIGAQSSQKGQFKYELPKNLLEIQEVFLDEAFVQSIPTGLKKTIPNDWELTEISNLMMSNPDKWDCVFDFFQKGEYVVSSFLTSKYFYDIAYQVYQKQYSDTIFVDFLWTMRSMYLTLFHLLNHPPHKADVYHAVSTGYAGIAGALAKHLYGGSFAITEHGIYTREREEEIIKASWVQDSFKSLWINYFRSLSVGAYKSADDVIALFETNQRIQIENGADFTKCQVIANGIDYKKFENIQGKTDDDKGYINVGAVIRVSPIKDIKTMLYAFDIVKRKVPNARFYIMGPCDEVPEYYEECLALLNELGTQDVMFTDRVQVTDYIGRMDVMVLSSISEGQPLSLMEAMAASIPCVSTNVGCCYELFNGTENDTCGVSGLLSSIMNEEYLARQIIKVVTNPTLASSMSKAGKERIITHYSEEKFRKAYSLLYKQYEQISNKE